jgi:hypothetical protein
MASSFRPLTTRGGKRVSLNCAIFPNSRDDSRKRPHMTVPDSNRRVACCLITGKGTAGEQRGREQRGQPEPRDYFLTGQIGRPASFVWNQLSKTR